MFRLFFFVSSSLQILACKNALDYFKMGMIYSTSFTSHTISTINSQIPRHSKGLISEFLDFSISSILEDEQSTNLLLCICRGSSRSGCRVCRGRLGYSTRTGKRSNEKKRLFFKKISRFSMNSFNIHRKICFKIFPRF